MSRGSKIIEKVPCMYPVQDTKTHPPTWVRCCECMACQGDVVWRSDFEQAREALLELHSAGLALAPEVGFVGAAVSVRWDEAMGAADDLLKRVG